jgi:hypothetical protein
MSGIAEAGKNCTCRANGQSYHEGAILCIRGKLSRCEMNQNVTSWKVIADDCPQVKAAPLTPRPIRHPPIHLAASR